MSAAADSFLRFDGVTIRLGGREILSPTSFDVARGEFVCIVGPSGCGKTTLLRAAIGKYIKLPPDVLAKVQVSPPGPVVTDKQLGYWTGLMKEQDMLKTNIDVAKLIAK